MSNKTNHPIPMRKVRYRYVPVQQTLKSEDNDDYVTFGISVRTVEEEIAFVSDVSTELEEVQRLTDLCTEKQLDPIYLLDVVEDFLVEGGMSVT